MYTEVETIKCDVYVEVDFVICIWGGCCWTLVCLAILLVPTLNGWKRLLKISHCGEKGGRSIARRSAFQPSPSLDLALTVGFWIARASTRGLCASSWWTRWLKQTAYLNSKVLIVDWILQRLLWNLVALQRFLDHHGYCAQSSQARICENGKPITECSYSHRLT